MMKYKYSRRQFISDFAIKGTFVAAMSWGFNLLLWAKSSLEKEIHKKSMT
ncbi:MAG TPA: hypothetical protein PKC21_01810 [Oligoflexia bacterium]|nr:hypothetical protein [bacterium]HMQ11368.1 hypothetical protein [Oligoflexia bacterium]HMR24066.1 hypothetical protein [Oligoflexia bacterium]